MEKISLKTSDGKTLNLVVKFIPDDKLASSKTLGLAREAFFFSILAQQLPSLSLPRTYYTHGDLSTGAKVVIMEDLTSHKNSGYWFGMTNPLNWGKDLASLTNNSCFTAEAITKNAVEKLAILHGTFWNDEGLWKYEWLNGVDWIQGKNQESWQGMMNWIQAKWDTGKARISDGQILIDDYLVKIVDASFSKVSWEAHQATVQQDQTWTLVHGDHHPGNWIVKPDDSKPIDAIVIDFEMVGVGNGAAEISQYLISHMDPLLRKNVEFDLLKVYYDSLIKFPNVCQEKYTFEYCKQQYVTYGFAHWV